MPSFPLNDRFELFGPLAGGEVELALNFSFYSITELVVKRTRAGTASTLTLGVDYTVAGAGADIGRAVNLTPAAVAADRYVVFADTSPERSTLYSAPADIKPAALNRQENRVSMTLQEHRRDLLRGVFAPFGESALTLPALADRISTALGFDEAGLPVALPNTDTGVFLGGTTPVTRALLLLTSIADILTYLGTGMQPFSFTGNGTPGPFTLPAEVTGNEKVILTVTGLTQRPTADYTVDGDQLTLTDNSLADTTYFGWVFP